MEYLRKHSWSSALCCTCLGVYSPTCRYFFADDTETCREIKTEKNRGILQEDLNSLQEWSKIWPKPFHQEKCKCMKVHGGYRQTRETEYFMQPGDKETIVKRIGKKILGVLINGRLIFKEHIQDKVNKAYKIMGTIKSSFGYLDVPIQGLRDGTMTT